MTLKTELAEVLALSEKATPGPWKFSPWHIEEGEPAVRSTGGWIICTAAGDTDAEIVAKSINFIRQHGEALMLAVEDAERFMYMVREREFDHAAVIHACLRRISKDNPTLEEWREAYDTARAAERGEK